MSGIQIAAPEGQYKLKNVLTFLVTQNDAKVTCHSTFKMLHVLSNDFWQQAVYHPSAKIDTVI